MRALALGMCLAGASALRLNPRPTSGFKLNMAPTKPAVPLAHAVCGAEGHLRATAAAAAAALLALAPCGAPAVADSTPVASITVSISKDAPPSALSALQSSPKAALLVVGRSLGPYEDNAFVAAKRLPLKGATFPLTVDLTYDDLVEGMPADAWRKREMYDVVNWLAKVDEDGVLATSGPSDLAAVFGDGGCRDNLSNVYTLGQRKVQLFVKSPPPSMRLDAPKGRLRSEVLPQATVDTVQRALDRK